MAQVKLKADTKADSYGAIPIEDNVNKKPKVGFFERLRLRWTHKKVTDDVEGVPSFLSLVSNLYLIDIS